jgi:hypothetical protein
LATSDGAVAAIESSEIGALGQALGGTLEPDGGPGRHRLAGRVPDPRAIVFLADWCEQRGLLLAELQTSGGTLEERFLELIAEARPEAGTGSGRGTGSDAA